jgi:ADP-ribose pyrophosphatase YjhB (NUDIX family)
MSSPLIFDVARRLQAISQTGLEYANNPFDRERYEQIAEIAVQLMSTATGHPAYELTQSFAFEKGYATPKIDVRAAVFRDNRILLVRELSDGLWTLPGGWADVGDSPSVNAVREVKEESGFTVRVTKLAAVYDRDLHGHPPIPFHTYKLVFLCELLGGAATTSVETDAVDFFDQNALPPLSTTRILEKQIHHMFEHHADPTLPTTFD